MGIFKRLGSLLKTKSIADPLTTYGGFEVLSRLTGNENWGKGKQLMQYEKSLYVFACVDKISEKVSTVPLHLYLIQNSKGDTTEIMNHPSLDLLYKPNPFQTKAEFLKITTINKKLTGDAFWYKIRDDRGEIQELWNLRPDYIEIIKDPVLYVKAYKFNKEDGTSIIIAPEDIIHHKAPNPLDQYFGISPVKPASVRIDTENYAGLYQRDFFLNNARPDGIIKANAGMALTEAQKKEIRQEFEKKHKGVGKNSKIAVVEGDLTYQQVSISQREMDYIESMKFTRDDILVAFGVPKAIVAITDDVNRANADTSMEIFMSQVVKPEIEAIVEKTNEELIIPDFGEQFFIGYDDPTPEDREKTIKDYETGLKSGYYLINEVRAKENMEPIEGGWALYKPLNEVAVGGMVKNTNKFFNEWLNRKEAETQKRKQAVFRGRPRLYAKMVMKEKVLEILQAKMKQIKEAQKPKTPKKKVPKKKELRGIITDEQKLKYANSVNKQIDQRAQRLKDDLVNLARTQEKQLKKKLPEDLTKGIGPETSKTINDFYAGQEQVFVDFIFPYMNEFAMAAGTEAMAMVNANRGFEMTAQIRATLMRRAEEFGLGVNNTTRERITAAIENGLAEGEGMFKISDRISDVYKEFPTWRADLIARTEATAANNEGFIEAYKQSDVVTHKEWINAGDSRVRPEHQNKPTGVGNEIVPVKKAFSNGLMYPQEPGCRCVIGPAYEN